MFCRKCGQPLPDDAVFCGNCGSRCVQPHIAGQQEQYRSGTNGADYRNVQVEQQFYRQAGGAWGAAKAMQGAGGAVQAAGKAAGSAVRTKMTIIIAAALVAIAVMLYILFFRAGKPEDTIQKMEDALNQLDTEELLECFDEQSQGIYTGMLGLGGDLLGVDLGALSDLASGLGGYMAAAGMTPRFNLTVTDVEYTGDDTCIVTVNMTVTYEGTTDSGTQDFPMVKDGREWVISAAGL